MKLFIMDTSSQVASVAAIWEGKILGEFTIWADRTHSQRVMPMVDAFLSQMNMKIRDFDAFAVCTGPGSFTGVRIGISTIKAFAQATGKPVYTFTSMQLLASAFPEHEGIVAVALDANKDEVYFGLYKWQRGNMQTLDEGVSSLESLSERVAVAFGKMPVKWAGDAVLKHQSFFEAQVMQHANQTIAPRAKCQLSSANYVYCHKEGVGLTDYSNVPAAYFKKSQAERDMK